MTLPRDISATVIHQGKTTDVIVDTQTGAVVSTDEMSDSVAEFFGIFAEVADRLLDDTDPLADL